VTANGRRRQGGAGPRCRPARARSSGRGRGCGWGRSLEPARLRRSLAGLWLYNARIGWPERGRGLHYWLGWEYAALLNVVEAPGGGTVLDVGTGPHSIWPYVLSARLGVSVIATDIDTGLAQQLPRRDRVERAGLAAAGSVQLLRADARRLPVPDCSVDAVTAVSTIEHVRRAHGDRVAVQEIARVLRPGGRAWLTLPFRAAGSIIELDDELEHFQWHYSPQTLQSSLIEPSGLRATGCLLYEERLPFYKLSRRLPSKLAWLLRPWATVLSALLLRVTSDPQRASAVLLELQSKSVDSVAPSPKSRRRAAR